MRPASSTAHQLVLVGVAGLSADHLIIKGDAVVTVFLDQPLRRSVNTNGVDLFDVDPTVLYRLHAGGEFEQPTCCGLWIGKRA